MKKLFLLLVFVAAGWALKANPVCYFTYSQARRTVNYLSMQDELMIYCGYEYELETYVIVSDVWYERVNQRYYEVWLYGFDAYTGEEIYMPIDLSCVWLFDRRHDVVYNAAKTLRFQCDAPYISITWAMPVYHGFTRMIHPTYYTRTYHYDVHRYGWRPTPAMRLPVYYMRPPSAPMPVIVNSYVPGRERPVVQVNNQNPSRPVPTTSRTPVTQTRTNNTATPSTTRPAGDINNSSNTIRPTNNGNATTGSSTTRPTNTGNTNARPTNAGNNNNATARPTSNNSSTRPASSDNNSTARPTSNNNARPTSSNSTRPTTTTQRSSQTATPSTQRSTTATQRTSTTPVRSSSRPTSSSRSTQRR